jgi:hypothetical protein
MPGAACIAGSLPQAQLPCPLPCPLPTGTVQTLARGITKTGVAVEMADLLSVDPQVRPRRAGQWTCSTSSKGRLWMGIWIWTKMRDGWAEVDSQVETA